MMIAIGEDNIAAASGVICSSEMTPIRTNILDMFQTTEVN